MGLWPGAAIGAGAFSLLDILAQKGGLLRKIGIGFIGAGIWGAVWRIFGP